LFLGKKKKGCLAASQCNINQYIIEAACLDMMRDKNYLNKLKAKAVIEESYEEAKDWKKKFGGRP
jgi:hypothetical protein